MSSLGIDLPTAVLLCLAILLALSFEFVNGFHDTANAVATVIYTHTLKPSQAVVWSGMWNLIGVLTSSGAVAFGIVALLPVELVINVGSGAGFAMVFALLLSSIIWNLGTWYLGLPASSSHTLIGSIVGVGLMNSLMSPGSAFGEGVNWAKVEDTVKALVFSPLLGFVAAALLLLAAKALLRNPALFKAPEGDKPPPPWIRGLLVLTCTGVSFAHGSNDGQKGMGLIVLILVGIVPTTFALNLATSSADLHQLAATSAQFSQSLEQVPGAQARSTDSAAAHKTLTRYLRSGRIEPDTLPALSVANAGAAAETGSRRRSGCTAFCRPDSAAFRCLSRGGNAESDAESASIAGRGRSGIGRKLPKITETADQFHSPMGEDRGLARARTGDHDRMEADRGDRR